MTAKTITLKEVKSIEWIEENGKEVRKVGAKVDATLTKAQFNKLINFALGVVEDFGVELPSLVNSSKGAFPGLLFKGDYRVAITADIDLNVVTSLNIK